MVQESLSHILVTTAGSKTNDSAPELGSEC